MPRDADSWLRTILLLLGLALGIHLRTSGIGEQPFFGDEYHTRDLSQASYGEILGTFDVVGSHVVLPLLQRVSLDTFGDGVTSMRLPALLPGLLTLFLMYPLLRPIAGRTPALIATLALAVSPMHVYYSRFARAYGLIVLLGLLLCVALVRAQGADARRRWWWGLAAVCAILLPYTHLSSAGFVGALGLASIAGVWSRERSSRALVAPGLAFGIALVVCVLLFLPLWGQVRAHLEAMPAENKASPYGWFGIPTLLAGGGLAAALWLILFPLGVGLMLRPRRELALVSAAAVLGPLTALLVVRPHGMEYAYARYLLNPLPFVLVTIAWVLCAALGRIFAGREALAERAAIAIAVVALAVQGLTGPLAPARGDDGPYGNTYLRMRALPAFDAPHPAPPAFYESLAEDPDATTVIEVQPLLSRAVLLYRNYHRLHGKRVLTGWLDTDELPRGMRDGPYVHVEKIEQGAADYMILHLDLRKEVNAYWRFVYEEAWPLDRRRGDEPFMERHQATFIRGQPVADPANASMIAAYLRDRFGPAFYKDERVLVWKLR